MSSVNIIVSVDKINVGHQLALGPVKKKQNLQKKKQPSCEIG